MSTRFRSVAALGAAALLLPFAAIAADADDDSAPRRRVRLGGVMVGASYMSGPAWNPYYGGWGPYRYGGWGLFDPYWSSPFIHPALYSGLPYSSMNTGGVKFINADKDASVYIDGAYAGTVHKLKTIRLEPGKYNVEVRGSNGTSFERKVYVLTGKTVELRAGVGRNEARP